MASQAKLIGYTASRTAAHFHASTAFVRGLMGPVGSGKSVACCFELFHKAMGQRPGRDGVRRSRVLVVRNTLPQLETTTIKTWLDWFPEDIFGHMTRKPPYTQVVRYRMSDGTTMQMEVIFIALDKPEDVKKLLSLECTWIWFNEAREIEREIVDAGTARVGRYPSVKDRPDDLPEGEPWPTTSGIIMDTNPPDDSHWWYRSAEQDEWRREAESGSLTPLADIPDMMRWQFFSQPSGKSPDAENIANLPAGYYDKISVGKNIEWVNVYVHGRYGFVVDGLPVYRNSYNQKLHLAEKNLPIDPYGPVVAGVDCSGRNPAAIFSQTGFDGQVKLVWELVCEGMGAEIFATLLRREINTIFPQNNITWWGDPAGFTKREGDERTYADILKAKAGISVRPAPVIRTAPRIAAMESIMLRLGPGAKPALLISPACKVFVRGLSGGYKYKRLQTSGEARHAPEPEKDRFSDVQDAAQYLVCGLGEYNKMTGKNRDQAALPGRASSRAVDLNSKEWNL